MEKKRMNDGEEEMVIKGNSDGVNGEGSRDNL